jgi:hypothetical protein
MSFTRSRSAAAMVPPPGAILFRIDVLPNLLFE